MELFSAAGDPALNHRTINIVHLKIGVGALTGEKFVRLIVDGH